MNFLSMLFKKKDKIADGPPPLPTIEMKDIVCNADVNEDNLYTLTNKISLKNIKEITKYWEKNIKSFQEKGDYIEYNGIKIDLKSINIFNSNFSNLFHLTLYPINDDNYKFSYSNYDVNSINFTCEITKRHNGFLKDTGVIKSYEYDSRNKVYEFLYNLTFNGEIKKKEFSTLKEYFESIGLSGRRLENFLSVNNGEYFIIKKETTINYEDMDDMIFSFTGSYEVPKYEDSWGYSIYKFDTWEMINIDPKTLLECWGESPSFEKCEDPKKTHWQHFLKLEVKRKEEYKNNVKNFVDSIFNIEEEYKKIINYDGDIIKDFMTFCELCDKTHQEVDLVKFDEFDITYEILDKLKQRRLGLHEKITKNVRSL